MLKIYYGKMDNAYYGPGWFINNYEPVWFDDELVKRMIKDIDKSEYVGGELIQSTILGPIAPERLSGGLKTLISIYERPDLIFDATSCGNNCAKWLVEIGRNMDVTVNLNYLMSFENIPNFTAIIDNIDKTFLNEKEFMLASMDVLDEEMRSEG